ncbi:hypothetical protein TC41_0596 [Alicyclobacillus acidocaldarius subsp. acidocaldarius Tc-4-1]|uniref:Uncharacterized protein n=1 Tax=Alicyclobacillus acidocaldarius (strain Tc-4-1) TaxID=1048834 RepID=F8ID89_ALIAT|nr:hypothetical protein TC41_0596 [Alicyclobacillus acidocaldarius subsp. acidocaldarius Tc-4-1]
MRCRGKGPIQFRSGEAHLEPRLHQFARRMNPKSSEAAAVAVKIQDITITFK